MVRFLKTVGLFSLIPLLVILIEGLLPLNFFAKSHYEALLFQSGALRNGPFYPNTLSSLETQGDLCYYTENAIIKDVIWQTDKLGFRNTHFIEEPDVLIIGDSFIAGNCNTQDDILSSQLGRLFNDTVSFYNMAPASITKFINSLQEGKIKKPKLLIYSIVERSIPKGPSIKRENKSNLKYRLLQFILDNNLNVIYDRFTRHHGLQFIKSRINGITGIGQQGIPESKMFFYFGVDIKDNNENIIPTREILNQYQLICDSLEIKFLFLPMPDKETVYYDFVPLPKQSSYLLDLDSIIQKEQICVVNTLKIYNQHRHTNDSLIYHLDDTHWNAHGISLVAMEIKKKIILENLLW